MAEKRLWNDGWEFCRGSLENFSAEKVPDMQFEPVDIPHDWMIEDTQNLYRDSIGWYRRRFHLEKHDAERTAVRFDGVYMDTTVFVNGREIGQWKYGYSTFEFDITDALTDGENEILVRVVYRSPNTRWYSGAGIYRNVWLKHYPDTHLETDGIYITTGKKADGWLAEVETEIRIGSVPVDQLRQRIFSPDGRLVAEDHCTVIYEERTKGTGTIRQELFIREPMLWDIGQGNLYTLRTELLFHRMVIEQEEQRFGLRTMEYTPEGFYLNGRKVKIQGVCEHHDFGCLGAAFSRAAMKRKFRILRSMGVNAIRTSHNMPAPELMDLADEMGFLVDSEAFDMWERPKTAYDYARFFPEWMEKDVASWVRRDRNHASLMMWSIGNEIYDTHADDRGQEITRMLKRAVEKNDPRKHAPVTIGSNYMQWENAQKCADIVKLAGYNYAERLYGTHHAEHPDWVIYGSETGSVLSSRGIYHFPLEKQILTDEDEQCSALGNCTTGWGAKNCEAFLTADRDAPFSMGQFLWTGFDYIGEPTPYQTKNSYFGQIDTAGFPKDSYYICQSQWTDYKKAPMVHVFPYWDFNPGQMIDVRVCSNAPRVELFLNDESQGCFEIDHEHGKDLLGHWKLPYTPGELKAVAYDEEGTVIAKDIRHSFGDAVRIRLSADKTIVKADGRDLIFVEISVTDRDGYPVENAKNRVRVTVTGAGRLVGLDNGDSTDFDQYQGTSRRLFSGKLLAVIASRLEPGRIDLKVSGAGLISCAQRYEAVASVHTHGLRAVRENRDCQPVAGGIGGQPVRPDESVVRKIEITCPEGTALTPEKKALPVETRLFPAGTSEELVWRVTNAAGVDSNLAKIRRQDGKVSVEALGDGSFYVRCGVKNRGTIVSVSSSMEFTAQGFGAALTDPYREVCGSLYTKGEGRLQEGNEHGVLFDGGHCEAVFEGLDFGDYGSDTVTLPIFAGEEELAFQIWEGMPGEEGSELLGDFRYQKPSKWMVYQPQTYRLKRRIRGVASLCFVTEQTFHLRGFVFQQYNKALQELPAAECSRIYGDTYRIEENTVLGIGNNVSLEFEQMDFKQEGVNRLTICGRSDLENNTIHIRFRTQEEETIQLAEFSKSEDWSEQVFELAEVKGCCDVSFVFLPGCRFDFKSFRFWKQETAKGEENE